MRLIRLFGAPKHVNARQLTVKRMTKGKRVRKPSTHALTHTRGQRGRLVDVADNKTWHLSEVHAARFGIVHLTVIPFRLRIIAA